MKRLLLRSCDAELDSKTVSVAQDTNVLLESIVNSLFVDDGESEDPERDHSGEGSDGITVNVE